MPLIAAIDARQQRRVRETTLARLRQAEALFGLNHRPIPVGFELRGRALGVYRVDRRCAQIQYNPYILARHFEHGLRVTVVHEVAHYIADRLFGLENIRPHGKEWRLVMQALGTEARASAQLDLTGVPIRRQRRFAYRCDCMLHQLSTCRHNRVAQGAARYHCRRCGCELVVDT